MKYIGVDIEAIGLKPYGGTIWMISITRIVKGKPKSELYSNCNGVTRSDLPAEVIEELEDENVCKIFHNYSGYDGPYLFLTIGIQVRNVWCTYINEIVIQGTRVTQKRKGIAEGSTEERLLQLHSASLEWVLPRYGFQRPDKSLRDEFIGRPKGLPFSKELKKYAIEDTARLPAIQKAQEFLLQRDGLLEVALLENKVSEVVSRMRSIGIGFDREIWTNVANENIAEYNRRLKKLPEELRNPSAHQKVKKFFMDRGVFIESYDDLDKVFLQTKNKLLGDFIFAKEIAKATTTYGLNWFEEDFIDADERVRCNVDQCINTGRMSVSKPPLQQMPGEGKSDVIHLAVMEQLYSKAGLKKSKPRQREAFVPRKGHVFVIGDFSGQEIGIMAAASNEQLWINAMLRGEDVHSLTASIIDPTGWAKGKAKGCTFPFKCECPQHKEMRRPAKINNFMLAYGGGPQKLADSTGMTMTEASMYVGAHKRVIPNLTRYLEKCGQEALDTGVSYSADPYRRRRVLRGEEAWQVRNQGKNTPIQAAGANMLKLAMISTPEEYPIVMVIHDEIILEVKKSAAPKASKVLKAVMEQSADYITGIKGLIKVKPRVAMNIMKD